METDLPRASMFADHRARTLAAMEPGSAMLIFSAHHRLRNADTEYPYRQRSDLYWLTGWTDPEAALLLLPGSKTPFVLFVQPKDPAQEVWTGIRPGPVGALEEYGADLAHDIGDLEERLPDLLMGCRTLYYEAMADAERDGLVRRSVARARRKARKDGPETPDAFIHPGRILHELRLRKSDAELALLREAAAITAEAHVEAMKATRPGAHEYELAALIDYTFRRRGGNGPGYESIVGGGANACILHYVTNRDPLNDGELVLVDAGCEYELYTADVTRTWPVNGSFTAPQRELYEVVLAAQLAAIDTLRPGREIREMHDAAVRSLTEGMVRLGLLEGEVDELIEADAFKRYYMHGTGHWLGIDVHDVGLYWADGASRRLEPGMVSTVEPGLYVAPDDEEAPERFRGIGIRIEDDVLVTEGEPEILTAAVPKTIEAIEALMRGDGA